MSLLANSLAPDLIVYNGAITTFAADMPTCSAVAMKDGRVIAIGDDARVRALAGDGTREIDLRGSCLLYTSPSPRDRTRSRMPSSA